ncbi:MAG: 30S ribosome-binding factor RbfA [Deltaproteobacteria bacterium]|jgi:ribosome-binding factor A|nr:30S ribosome-binding factor RbfA [Deltaproteobacteria bacterium]
MKSAVQRTDRVGDLLRREISQILSREVKEPLAQFVTITGVRVSKDLRNACVYYTALQDDDTLKDVAAALKRSAGFVQRMLGSRIQLRSVPHLRFEYDTSLRDGARMDELLRGIDTGSGDAGE